MLLTSFHRYGNAGLGVLFGREEECPINQRVTVVNAHRFRANDAKRSRHFVHCQIGKNEATDVVIAITALIFHFNVKRVELVAWQGVEGAEIGSVQEKTAVARPVSGHYYCC